MYSTLISKERVNGYTVELHSDDSGCARYEDCSHLGRIVYSKRSRYCLGDTPMSGDEIEELLYLPELEPEDDQRWQELEHDYLESNSAGDAFLGNEILIKQRAREKEISETPRAPRPDLIVLPVSAYVHSGATIWAGYSSQGPPGTNCVWDSGQSGFVYCTHDDYRQWAQKPKDYILTPGDIEQARKILDQEVQEFDHYLCGEIYGFIVRDDCGEEVDSCWGFVGDEEYCEEAGRESAKHQPLLQGTLEAYADGAGRIAAKARGVLVVEDDPKVERVAGTRTAWVHCKLLVNLDEGLGKEEE